LLGPLAVTPTMGSSKRDRPSEETKDETKDEKKARKRPKKEAKKRKSEGSKNDVQQQIASTTDSEKNEILSDLLFRRKLRLNASILPSGLSDVKGSIDRCIREFLLKYSEGVGGIVLAYKNVDILKKARGSILEELPHIHYDVTCEALVFSPVPKAKLWGRVTESFHSHISLIVFNYFNASVSAAQLRQSGFDYNAEKDMWYETKSEYVIDKAANMSFTIDKVHEAGTFPLHSLNRYTTTSLELTQVHAAF
jgi:DNA-directed RNA polymerase subunit E'/Rpb7